MTQKNDDPFAWRTQGKRFEIGDDGEGGIYDMISMNGDLLCVTKNNIHSIRLADSVDPKRTNPAIPDMQQKVLPYGPGTPFVGRTFLQAKVLFENHCLVESVDCSKGIHTGLYFLKEIVSLHESTNAYVSEENEKNKTFEGKMDKDGSLRLPSMDSHEQRAKQFVINADHASRHLMEIAQLFYSDIQNKNWCRQLNDKMTSDKKAASVGTDFVESMCKWTWLMRNLRNAVEHPEPDDKVEIQNYRLTETGKVLPPTILYAHNLTPLTEMRMSQFMIDTIENLLTCFEVQMAYLCNMHTKTFAGDMRSVIEIPIENRSPNREHVRFGYHIAWTK